MEDALLGNFKKDLVRENGGSVYVRPQPIQRSSQRFSQLDGLHYKVRDDDQPGQNSKVVPYHELYALEGTPFHCMEGVKHYIDRKRNVEKMEKIENQKRIRMEADKTEKEKRKEC